MIISEKLANETNREYAFRMIRQNIIDLNLKPGSLVGEQELAQELNISRTPVHEAFLELSKTRIVEILPQRGCRVSLIDTALVEEARFIRVTMESKIVEMACRLVTPEDLNQLEANIKLQEFYIANPAPQIIMDLDNFFHQSLYKICNMMQCYYMVKSMNIHFDRIRSMSLTSVKDLKIVADHRLLLDALTQRDAQKAHDILVKHLSRIQYDEKEIREKYPEYFVN